MQSLVPVASAASPPLGPVLSRFFRAFAIAAVLFAQAGCTRRNEKLGFNQAIAPILSDNCYQCHGPDPGARKAGLRLDRAEFAFAPRKKSGPAIVSGDPDHSLVIQRIETADPKLVMPPPEAHKTFKPGEAALLRRWIKEGAEYQEHWAFIPPQRPPVPPTARAGWADNPIDSFILSRLERERLSPSPEADRSALMRRVTYDLTGLPPTPQAVDAFVRDPSPAAYERVVDRLLASPAYGEHRAHYWLDAVRYGDTQGLHFDNYRSVWPYRDYVIKSFNENKPFDRFTREQIAGDLLPPDNVDQLVASAFIRLGISTGEGGSIPEEVRVANQRERAEAFGAVFLGLTTGCAVCHDHKFDPLTQKDFYRLTAFFNNLTEIAIDRSVTVDFKVYLQWAPFIKIPKPEKRPAYDALLAQRAGIQRQINSRRRRARGLIATWLEGEANRPRFVPTAGLAMRLRCDEGKGAVLFNSAPGAAVKSVATTGAAPSWGEYFWFWPSFRMDTATRVELPGIGNEEKNQAFSVGTWVMPRYNNGDSKNPPFGTIIGRVDSTRSSQGWKLVYNQGKLGFRLAHRWPDDALAVQTAKSVLAGNRWNHILATYDGSGRAAGMRLYVDGNSQEVEVEEDALAGSVRTDVPLQLARDFPDASPLSESCYQDLRFYTRALPADEATRLAFEDTVAEIVRRPSAQWTENEFKTVSDFYFANLDESTRALSAQLPAIQEGLDQLSRDGDICLVCEESPGLAYADVLARGVYSDRIERVRPAVPHFLPQLPSETEPDRLGLADWVVSSANPLTARVTVNRMWQEVFGAGLVETTEDFGLMGDRPSHPELLDWLAVDFRESGWNVKRFYKQLVMSATYRQSARTTPALSEEDPRNRLLARGPRFRMDAEMVRDTALAASGLLAPKIGGPSVKPYQPAGVWESGAVVDQNSSTAKYTMDQGEGLYRRSLYSFWKRMVMMPNLQSFDAPARDSSCTRRQRSDTPLQALVAMNDPQWLEAARRLAERVVLESGATEARLDYLGRLLLARAWRPEEKAVLIGAVAKFRSAYADKPKAAAELIAVGESRPDPRIPPAELAPWMLVASTALNLDATLNK